MPLDPNAAFGYGEDFSNLWLVEHKKDGTHNLGGSLPFTPETFGAIGDGTTDDTTALLAWSLSSSHLALTAGKTYMHRQPLQFSTANQVVDGRGATLKRVAQAVTTTATAITSGVTNQITVAAVAGGAGAGAWTLKAGDYIVIEQGGTFDGSARQISSVVGLVVTIFGTFGASLSGTTNVRHGWNQLLPYASNQRFTNIVVDGNLANWSWGRWQHTVAIQSFGNTPYLQVDHCRVINQYGDGLTAQAIGTRWAFNSVENIKGRGFVFAGITGAPTNFDTRVLYNRFINCNTDINVGGNDGTSSIDFSQGGPASLIHGNYIDGGVDGIGQIAGENNGDLTITGNEIWNCSGRGIKAAGSSQIARDVVITGNRVYASNIEIYGTTTIRSRFLFHSNLVIGGSLIFYNVDKLSIQSNHFDCAALLPPQLVVATAVATGGTFAAATYYYQLTATNSVGETVGSTEVSAVVALNGSVALTWNIVPGATGYKIYRATSAGAENVSPTLVATITSATVASYTDTGTATSAGNVPATNTTGLDALLVLQPGQAGATTKNVSIALNHITGGSYATYIRTGCSNILVKGNVLVNQHTGGIVNQGAGNTNIAIQNNLVVCDATAAAGYVGLNMQQNDEEVTGNLVDISAMSGVAGANCVQVAASASNTIIKNNNFKGVGGTTVCVVINASASNVILVNNRISANLNSRVTDNGTNTSKYGNSYSAGPVEGKAVLVAGTKTVSTPEVQTGDTILLTTVLVGGTQGFLSIGTIVNGTSFVINSSNAADTSTIYWRIDH